MHKLFTALLFSIAIQAADPTVKGVAVVPRSDLSGAVFNPDSVSALNGEVFVAAGTTGTNALPASRTTNTTVLVQSTAGNGTNAFRVNAAVTHSSGNLMEVQNNGTNLVTVDYTGEIAIGANNTHSGGSGYSIYSLRSTAADGWHGNGIYLEGKDGSDTGSIDMDVRSDRSQINLIDKDGNFIQLKARSGVEFYVLGVGNKGLEVVPTQVDGSAAYIFGTTLTHATGNLGEFKNNATNYVQIPADQAATNAPLILNINGVQKRVHVGDADSGGTGLRALTIEN